METQEPRPDKRRSTRIALSIPIVVSGKDGSGTAVRENVTTILVSKHGALMFLEHRFPAGCELSVHIPHLARKRKCKVAWASEEKDEQGKYTTGVELERGENFWGVQFPPGDWTIPKHVPLAGNPLGPFPLQGYFGEQELQMVPALLTALITLLEEKGVVSRAELTDILKRIG